MERLAERQFLVDSEHRLAQADQTVCGIRLYVDRANQRAQRAYEQLGMKKAQLEMYEVDFVL